MKYDIYPVKASDSLLQFEFTSEGPKGRVNKLIEYKELEDFPNVYSLDLGDIGEAGIDYRVITNNGDTKKVLLTVVFTIPRFFFDHNEAKLLIFGNTAARTRLFRMMISINLKFFESRLDVFGLVGGKWYLFKENFAYEGFMIQKKHSNVADL